MTREKDGRSLARKLADEVADFPRSLRVHAVGGLVEHEQITGTQECGRQPESLLHAEGVRAVALASRRIEANPSQRVVDSLPARRAHR